MFQRGVGDIVTLVIVEAVPVDAAQHVLAHQQQPFFEAATAHQCRTCERSQNQPRAANAAFAERRSLPLLSAYRPGPQHSLTADGRPYFQQGPRLCAVGEKVDSDD